MLLSSDLLRKELAGIDPATPAPADFGQGLYDGPHTAATYAELLRRAEVLLGRGESVVLDASWTDARHRATAEHLADHTRSRLIRLACQATAETTGRRLGTRTHKTSDPWPETICVPIHRTLAESLELASSAWRDATHSRTRG